MRLPWLALSCLLLPVLTQPIPADPIPPTNLRPDILYTHRGEFVQVKPMRPLTLNAHVTEFAYDPLGIEIAYSGSNVEGDKTTYFVKTVDTHTGHELSRYAFTAPTEDRNTALSLIGWSVSGKYLLLKKFVPDPSQPDTAVTEFLRWDLSVSPQTIRVIDPQAALPAETTSGDDSGADGFVSPDSRWLGFRHLYNQIGEDGKPQLKTAYLLYDPERDTFKRLTLPPGVNAYSWSDNTHLMFWEHGDRKQFDINTWVISPLTTSVNAVAPLISKQYPDLSVDTQNPTQTDAKGSDSYLSSYLIWIRRTPFGKMPLGVAAAGLMPAPAHHNVWDDDNPKAVWSPTGRQVAFIANTDLCVTDLVSASGALPHEKLAVGLKLSCADERELAMSNVKQIGLGIIQYAQDFDEHFPPAEGINETIYPYIKSRDVFGFGGHNFVYKAPKDLSLAAMDAPADTELGFIDLPCARVVLFCDGHVKAFPKQETMP